MYLPTLQEYERMLQQFDWYYDMADDYTIWKQNSVKLSELLRLKAELDPHGTIWDRVKKDLNVC
jgi:hypothetical protein